MVGSLFDARVDDTALLTPHLCLRLLDADDSTHRALYRALYSSESVMAAIGPVLSPKAADAACRKMALHNRAHRPGHRTWAIEDRHDGSTLGIVALHRRGPQAELGLMLLPEAWTGRISTQALAPVIAHGFQAMGLERIEAGCREGLNARLSRRLLAPFPFERIPAEKPGTAYWALARSAWIARGAVQYSVASDPACG